MPNPTCPVPDNNPTPKMSNPTLDLEQIHTLAERAVEDCYPEGNADAISDAIRPVVHTYIEAVVAQDGLPESGSGWTFRDDIEVLLVKCDNGKYIPSVRSDYWDAPASTIDPDCGVDDPLDALTWGLTDALAYEIADDLTPDDEDEE